MSFGEEMAAVADEVLSSDMAKTVTLRRDQGEYDPATGTTKPADGYDAQRVGAVLQGYSVGVRDGELVRAGDLRATLPAQSLAWPPETGDRLLVDDESWTVKAVDTHWGGDRPVLYELQIRR